MIMPTICRRKKAKRTSSSSSSHSYPFKRGCKYLAHLSLSVSSLAGKIYLSREKNKDNGSNGKYDVVMCFSSCSFLLCLLFVEGVKISSVSVSVHLFLPLLCDNMFFFQSLFLLTVCGKCRNLTNLYISLTSCPSNVVIYFFLLPCVYCLWKVEIFRICIFLSLPVSHCNIFICLLPSPVYCL